MDALSTSVEVEFSPNVADAQKGSASITSAMLATNMTGAALCVLSGVVIPGSIQWFGCMSFLLMRRPALSGMGRFRGSCCMHPLPAVE